MHKPLQQVQQALRDRLNNLRCLERLVTSKEFEAAYKVATDEQQKLVNTYIEKGETHRVQQWLTVLERDSIKDIGSLSIRDLRKLASGLGIPGYHLLLKASLLSRIMEIGGDREAASANTTAPRRDEGADISLRCTGSDVQQDPQDRCHNNGVSLQGALGVLTKCSNGRVSSDARCLESSSTESVEDVRRHGTQKLEGTETPTREEKEDIPSLEKAL